MPCLRNRLAVSACLDLAKHCPRTVLAMPHWLDQVGFWLADLSVRPTTPDQVWGMIGQVAHPYAWAMGMSWPEACQVVKEQMALHQLIGRQ